MPNRMKLKCNSPVRNPAGSPKKFKVLACANGKKKTIQFGDSSTSIKKSIPARKKSYCARSAGQGSTTNKLSALFWARKSWGC